MSISPSYIKFRILDIFTIYWTLYSLYNYVAVVGPCLPRVAVTLLINYQHLSIMTTAISSELGICSY